MLLFILLLVSSHGAQVYNISQELKLKVEIIPGFFVFVCQIWGFYYLPAKKLARYFFLDAGKRQSPRSATKDFIAPTRFSSSRTRIPPGRSVVVQWDALYVVWWWVSDAAEEH